MRLRLADASSLKAKRAAMKPILEGARRRFAVASAEADLQDDLGRADLVFAAASGSFGHVTEVLDAVERFVWSFPEIEVTSADRGWVEEQ